MPDTWLQNGLRTFQTSERNRVAQDKMLFRLVAKCNLLLFDWSHLNSFLTIPPRPSSCSTPHTHPTLPLKAICNNLYVWRLKNWKFPKGPCLAHFSCQGTPNVSAVSPPKQRTRSRKHGPLRSTMRIALLAPPSKCGSEPRTNEKLANYSNCSLSSPNLS